MSRSIANLLAWTRERFPLSVYGPLVLLLEAARMALAGRPGEALACRVGLALFTLVALRLWDDLASADRDARDHPSRVLPRASSKRPFHAAAAAAGAGAALLAASSPRRLAILGALAAYYACLYARDRARDHRTLAVSFGVLAKYPAIAALLAAGDGALSARGLVVLATVFASFAVYEVAHDASVRRLPGAPLALRVAALTVIVGGIALAGLSVRSGLATALLQGLAACAGAAAAVVVVRATRGDCDPPARLRWLPFVTTATQLLFVAMWRP